MEENCLAQVLTAYMENKRYNSRTLSERSTVPKGTVDNIKKGRSKRPQSAVPLILIAAALELEEDDTDKLLKAGGYPPVRLLDREFKGDKGIRQALERWKIVQQHLRKKGGSIQPFTEMRESRYGHTATLLQDGRVLIIGGYGKARLSAELPLLHRRPVFSTGRT